MNTKRIAQLRLEALKKNISPDVINVKEGDFFQNASDTKDDEPIIGDSWIEYWQIFSKQAIPPICPFCGRPLNEDEAEVCHVWLHKLDPMFGLPVRIGKSKYYIILGHQGCNNQHEQIFRSHININAVEAIKK